MAMPDQIQAPIPYFRHIIDMLQVERLMRVKCPDRVEDTLELVTRTSLHASGQLLPIRPFIIPGKCGRCVQHVMLLS
jgi:hypothetical protein